MLTTSVQLGKLQTEQQQRFTQRLQACRVRLSRQGAPSVCLDHLLDALAIFKSAAVIPGPESPEGRRDGVSPREVCEAGGRELPSKQAADPSAGTADSARYPIEKLLPFLDAFSKATTISGSTVTCSIPLPEGRTENLDDIAYSISNSSLRIVIDSLRATALTSPSVNVEPFCIQLEKMANEIGKMRRDKKTQDQLDDMILMFQCAHAFDLLLKKLEEVSWDVELFKKKNKSYEQIQQEYLENKQAFDACNEKIIRTTSLLLLAERERWGEERKGKIPKIDALKQDLGFSDKETALKMSELRLRQYERDLKIVADCEAVSQRIGIWSEQKKGLWEELNKTVTEFNYTTGIATRPSKPPSFFRRHRGLFSSIFSLIAGTSIAVVGILTVAAGFLFPLAALPLWVVGSSLMILGAGVVTVGVVAGGGIGTVDYLIDRKTKRVKRIESIEQEEPMDPVGLPIIRPVSVNEQVASVENIKKSRAKSEIPQFSALSVSTADRSLLKRVADSELPFLGCQPGLSVDLSIPIAKQMPIRPKSVPPEDSLPDHRIPLQVRGSVSAPAALQRAVDIGAEKSPHPASSEAANALSVMLGTDGGVEGMSSSGRRSPTGSEHSSSDASGSLPLTVPSSPTAASPGRQYSLSGSGGSSAQMTAMFQDDAIDKGISLKPKPDGVQSRGLVPSLLFKPAEVRQSPDQAEAESPTHSQQSSPRCPTATPVAALAG
ncbi:MAG: hypothetical protein A2103_05620 [Gammaproteobacteria bacterium GWF2_41_13]|nr:MAG: hypothetical protein A2103_05620 [Gammaproteobacteria bacterium GWF2_41_13]